MTEEQPKKSLELELDWDTSQLLADWDTALEELDEELELFGSVTCPACGHVFTQ